MLMQEKILSFWLKNTDTYTNCWISLKKKPLIKIEFDFEIFNKKKELLTTGNTSLVFIDMIKNKPTKIPQALLEKIYKHF